MVKQSTIKKSFTTIVTSVAAGALLIAPAGAVFANGSHGDKDGNRSSGRGSSDNNSSRHSSDKDYNKHRGDSWWSDWRFGDGKKDWEDEPETCEERQESIDRQTKRLKDSSSRQLKRLSWQISFNKWYVDEHELEPENFEQMLTDADANKTEAKEAINALVSPTVDCEEGTVEADKALLQLSKQPVIMALRDYHIDAVNISYAVQAAQ